MKNNSVKYMGTILIAIGLILVAAGVLLAGWHYWSTCQVKKNTQNILAQMDTIILGSENGEGENTSDPEMEKKLKTLYRTHPEVSMPVASIGEETFVGRMDFPDSGLSLPVLNDYSETYSENMPCRDAGSAYQDNLVIEIPTGVSKLGSLDTLGIGDRVNFTDMDGNCFSYTVTGVEEIGPECEEGLQEGDWDLTLYGAIYEGRYAIAVHCTRSQDTAETLGAFLSVE